MKLINPSVKIIQQSAGLKGIYQQIEKAGRNCYQSQDKITEDSSEKFTEMMVKSKHLAMCEHGTVYLFVSYKSPLLDFDEYLEASNIHIKYKNNKYSRVVTSSIDNFITDVYITTNYRVLIENDWLDDLKYLCEPTEYHEKRITVEFTTGIDITREFNRHRVNSMAESSTRYCNYSKNKFDNEISIATNVDISEQDVESCIKNWGGNKELFRKMCVSIAQDYVGDFDIIDTWLFANLACEWSYMRLIELGWKAQQARRVLPLDTNSILVHTAFESDWKHFLSLRSTDCDAIGVHPDAALLANKLNKLLV